MRIEWQPTVRNLVPYERGLATRDVTLVSAAVLFDLGMDLVGVKQQISHGTTSRRTMYMAIGWKHNGDSILRE